MSSVLLSFDNVTLLASAQSRASPDRHDHDFTILLLYRKLVVGINRYPERLCEHQRPLRMDWEKRSFFPNAVLADLNQFLAQLAYRSHVYFTQPLHPIFAIVHHPQACLEHVAGVHGSLYGLDVGAGDTVERTQKG